MNEAAFLKWLLAKFSASTAKSRMANCKRIEEYEGSLDRSFERDKGASLIAKLSYSAEDKRNGKRSQHNVPIAGDIYNGTATLRSAAKLYFEFKSGILPEKSLKRNIHSIAQQRTNWPDWNVPSDAELIELVKLSAKYIRFIDPLVVRLIVEDNQKNLNRWSDKLIEKSIQPEIYLWDKSPCAFPGVRRYSGSKEIAYFRKHTDLGSDEISNAVKLDDNDFPKHLWSFLFRGKPFQKFGPKGYALAHLADHKESNNRMESEFNRVADASPYPLLGLFTCPTNTAFVPTSLLRPTDFSIVVRKLLIRKANELYGDFCNILPPWLQIPTAEDSLWIPSNYEWASPVGSIENVKGFLHYRKSVVDEYLEMLD